MNEENQVIHRDIILPIPSDPALKVDVSTTYRLYRFVHTLSFSLSVVVFNVRSVFFLVFFFHIHKGWENKVSSSVGERW